jgi:cell division protein FtsI (penicillin-binding protein 3)/stage V sporulation protein D (sporulation-specific penicillin-binding protein)
MAARGVNRRIRILLFVFTLVFALTLGRAMWLQTVRAQSLGRMATGQQQQKVTIPAHRGTIFDRHGFQLAIAEQATTVYADPRQITDPANVARAVGRELGLNPDDVYRTISDRSKGFVYVARQADPKAAARLQHLHLSGLGFYREERRVYPQGRVAPQLLGYAGVDNKGLAGIELGLDRLLGGRPGAQTVVRDPYGRAIDVVSSTPEIDGRDVYLTVDHAIQANAQAELWKAVHQWHAKGATAIVMNPRTGAILAMANAPGFDANHFAEVSQDLQRNKAITDTYEPGSTFKLVTVAGVLSDGLVAPTSEFTLAPEIHVADRTIHDAEARATVTYTVQQILAHSSNVGAITLAEILTHQKRDVSYWISRFGFGHKTGIDFPGESAGIVVPPSRWTGATIGNVPIGHGIAVTPVQMAAAYAAIANGGVWVQPHIVARVSGQRPPALKHRRIVSRYVAAELTNMLRDVVIEGTGTKAEIPGYQVAGKTGTAAIPTPQGYSDSKYVSSFVGYVPAGNPQLLVLVTVDQPQGAIYGGMVAAPVFQAIAKFDLQYLEILPHQ